MNFGAKLQKLRKEKKMSQRNLAAVLNVSHVQIGKYERSENEPDITSIKRLSQIFDVSVDYLLTDENDLVTLKKVKYSKLVESVSKIEKIAQDILEIMQEDK